MLGGVLLTDWSLLPRTRRTPACRNGNHVSTDCVLVVARVGMRPSVRHK